MKNLFITITILFSVCFYGQTVTTESFLSAKLNTKRDITVKLPKSYEKATDRAYPMILVLDSEYLFGLFDANLTYGKSWDDMPDVILVGINQNQNNERYDDCEMDEKSGLPTDKSSAFFDFIGTELMPHLEKKYRISAFRGIAGVDTTAGFINTFLYKDMPIFNSYISISPDLALEMEQRVAQRLNAIKKPIFYYQATSDLDLKKFQTQIKTLDENIRAVKKDTMVHYKFDKFKNIPHYGIAACAIPSALYQIFNLYQPISNTEYKEKIEPLKEGHVAYLRKKYEIIEKELGVKLKVRYTDFLAIENAIKKHEAWYEYEELAQISGEQYEKTMLYDYHMAVYWEKRKEYKRALMFYQNSFVKQPIGDLTKDYMMNKVEEIKRFYPPKKDKLKGGQAKRNFEDTTQPLPDAPATPEQQPATDTPPTENKDTEKPKN